MLEKIERTIKNGQSKDAENIGKKDKMKKNLKYEQHGSQQNTVGGPGARKR